MHITKRDVLLLLYLAATRGHVIHSGLERTRDGEVASLIDHIGVIDDGKVVDQLDQTDVIYLIHRRPRPTVKLINDPIYRRHGRPKCRKATR